MRLVGFIIRIYHDARSPERQKSMLSSFVLQSLQTQCLNPADAHLSHSISSVPTVTASFVRQTGRSTRFWQ